MLSNECRILNSEVKQKCTLALSLLLDDESVLLIIDMMSQDACTVCDMLSTVFPLHTVWVLVSVYGM